MRFSYKTMPSWAIWPTGGCCWWRLIRNSLLWQFELSGLTSLCLGFPGGSDGKESVCNAGDLGLIPGLGRSPGEGNGNILQYSCLENPMDRGAWWDAVHGVSKSQTQLEWLTQTHTNTTHSSFCIYGGLLFSWKHRHLNFRFICLLILRKKKCCHIVFEMPSCPGNMSE